MNNPEGELRLMVEGMKANIRGMGKALGKKMGSIGEPKSPKEQMAAYDDMQPGDWVRMIEERGIKDTNKFRAEMKRRKELSDANRKPV